MALLNNSSNYSNNTVQITPKDLSHIKLYRLIENKQVMELLDNSSNYSNNTDEVEFSQFAGLIVALGWTHLSLVIVPVAALGPTVLSIFLINKKLRDPVSSAFICVIVLCIVGPLSNGLPMDISFITGFEVFGSCRTRWPRVFWWLNTASRWQLLLGSTLLSVVQYITVRWGRKKISTCTTILTFLALSLVSLLVALVTFLGPETLATIRGSLCTHPGSPTFALLTTLVSVIVFTIPLVTITAVYSGLTIKHVKTNTVENSQLVRNVTMITITWATIVTISRFLPVLTLLINARVSVARIDPISAAISYLVEMMYPLFLIFLLFAHKTTRTTVLRKLRYVSKAQQRTHSDKVASITASSSKETSQKKQI